MSRCQQPPRDTQAERKPLTPPSPPRCGCLYLPKTHLLFQSRLSLAPIGPEALGSASSSWGWALRHGESPAAPLGELTLHGTVTTVGREPVLSGLWPSLGSRSSSFSFSWRIFPGNIKYVPVKGGFELSCPGAHPPGWAQPETRTNSADPGAPSTNGARLRNSLLST